MAPCKEVRSLQDLSASASSRHIYAACKSIQATFSSSSGNKLAFDSDDCKLAVLALQDHIRLFVRLTCWEPLFHSVIKIHEDLRQIADERIVYATFLYGEVPIAKFRMPRLPSKPPMPSGLYKFLPSFFDKDAVQRKFYDGRVTFWLVCVQLMKKNLVELDLRQICCEEIIEAFCTLCTELVSLQIASSMMSDKAELIILSCGNLQKIQGISQALIKQVLEKLKNVAVIEVDCPWGIPGDTVAAVDHRLKLRSLRVHSVQPEQVKLIADRCPQLEELHIRDQPNHFSSAKLQALAFTQLQLSKLTLQSFHINIDALDNFMSTKGIYLHELSIITSLIEMTPLRFLQILTNCQHLTKLSVVNQRGWQQNQPSEEQVSFSHLRYLHVQESDIHVGLCLAKHCLDNASHLTVLKLDFLCPNFNDSGQLNDALGLLFGHAQMRQMKKVRLQCVGPSVGVCAFLANHVVTSCPAMTHLEIGPLTEYAKHCVDKLTQESNSNNLDLDIKYNRFHFEVLASTF